MIEQFVSDMRCSDQRYAVIIRSPAPSGVLSAVHLPPLPEGYAFYGAAQLPKDKTVEIFEYALPIFAINEIDYLHQAVGVLVGDNLAMLKTLKQDTVIELDPNFSVDRTAADALSDYPVIAYETSAAGNSDACFEAACSIAFSSLKIASQYTARSELFSVITIFREDGLDIYVPTQWPFHVRTAVAKVTGLAEESIVIYPTNTGETYNELLWYPSLLACQCAATAVLERKTVSLTLPPDEGCTAAPKTPEIIIEHRSALSPTYEITAMHISITINAGAYCPLIGNILKHMVSAALGPYNIPDYRIEARAVKTTEGLVDIFEGWGDAHTSNALENHINRIIQEYNLAPVDWHIRHIAPDHTVHFSSLFKLLTDKSDFSRKYAAYRVFNCGKRDKRDGQWRGIGIAGGFHYSGCPVNFTYTVELTLNVSNKLIIKTEPIEAGVKAMITKRAAKKLEIDEADIIFAGHTTKDMPISGPASAGAVVSVLFPLVDRALIELQEQRFRNPLPINIVRTVSTAQLRIQDTLHQQSLPFISRMPTACIIELEMDTTCYEIHIRNIWFACACGKIYEKNQLLSYLRKNITAALAKTAQWQDAPASDKNRCSYVEYLPIPINEIPPISIYLLEQESVPSTFESCAFNILPAAYLAALNQILLRIPSQIEMLPIRAEHRFKAVTGKDYYENTIPSK